MALPLDMLPSPEAERRLLTVLLCNLADLTALAGHLDPEDLREVVQAYHQTCTEVMQRFDGYLAQYLGDGVLAYFGYPVAHEDDAQRAVCAGLDMLDALEPLTTRLRLPREDRVAVRLGLHTGVVVDAVGVGARYAPLALGGTPTIAARLQALAAPKPRRKLRRGVLPQGATRYSDHPIVVRRSAGVCPSVCPRLSLAPVPAGPMVHFAPRPPLAAPPRGWAACPPPGAAARHPISRHAHRARGAMGGPGGWLACKSGLYFLSSTPPRLDTRSGHRDSDRFIAGLAEA